MTDTPPATELSPPATDTPSRERGRAPTHPGVRAWLGFTWLMVACMVAVGGITRLTGSGLSMVEWRPLMGALPPIGPEAWGATFAKYQATPQYALVNHWMTLADFQQIFFWEYLHRLLGRLIGVLFLVPWAWFLVRGHLSGALRWKTAAAFVLGGLQGALGWYMVKSGLVDVPAVSHYRLAAHLSLAFIVACWLAWLWFELGPEVGEPTPAALGMGWALALGVSVQVVWGAFMAGKRAGLVFSTFPDLNGEWVPSGLWALTPAWLNLVESPVAIHFVHRTLGYLVAAACVGFAWWARSRARSATLRRRAGWVGVVAVAQVALGVLTVVWAVPVLVATAHQVVGLVLLTAVVGSLQAARG